MMQELELSDANRVALVTGAGRGIGKAIAIALAKSDFQVALIARTVDEINATAQEIAATGGQALAIQADVRDGAAVRDAVATTNRQLGRIALLINNAGSAGPAGNDWEVDPAEWWECIEGALRGAFLFNHEVIPGMISAGQGTIIHIASLSGTRAFPPITATSVAKTAVIRLNEGLAAMLSTTGVVTFAIHPGVVDTALLRSYGLELPSAAFSSPEVSAGMCLRLASGKYDRLSGRFLTINDDLDQLAEQSTQDSELLTLRIRQ